jgi:hypothetical protein
MVNSQKKDKTIHKGTSEMVDHTNHYCKHGTMEKGLKFPIYHAAEETVNYCVASVATAEQIRLNSRHTNYAELKPNIFYKVQNPLTYFCTAQVKAFLLSNSRLC